MSNKNPGPGQPICNIQTLFKSTFLSCLYAIFTFTPRACTSITVMRYISVLGYFYRGASTNVTSQTITDQHWPYFLRAPKFDFVVQTQDKENLCKNQNTFHCLITYLLNEKLLAYVICNIQTLFQSTFYLVALFALA